MSSLGVIVIDTALAGQKVGMRVMREKVAYEEYGALIGGIAVASIVTAGAVFFIGPGLILLTVVGGVSALVGAEGGRELSKVLYSQISAYEAAMPSERKQQLLSEVQ